jgi:hypothetical protein
MFSQLFSSLPTVLVCIAALVISILRWQHAPRAALFSVLGFGLIAFNSVFGVFFYGVFVNFAHGQTSMMSVIMLISFFRTLLNAGALVLLLVAVFVGRESKRDKSPFDPANQDTPS